MSNKFPCQFLHPNILHRIWLEFHQTLCLIFVTIIFTPTPKMMERLDSQIWELQISCTVINDESLSSSISSFVTHLFQLHNIPLRCGNRVQSSRTSTPHNHDPPRERIQFSALFQPIDGHFNLVLLMVVYGVMVLFTNKQTFTPTIHLDIWRI